MALTTPLPPAPAASCVPYAEATPTQVALVLTYAKQALAAHFPTLSAPAWGAALDRLQPALWVEADQVYLDDEDLARLTHRLSTSRELPQLSPPIYNNEACYLARRLVSYQHLALHALAEVEAAPLAYGGNVLALVFAIAAGNGIALQVHRVTHPESDPGLADARQAAGARIEAVRAARGELAYITSEKPTLSGQAAGY